MLTTIRNVLIATALNALSFSQEVSDRDTKLADDIIDDLHKRDTYNYILIGAILTVGMLGVLRLTYRNLRNMKKVITSLQGILLTAKGQNLKTEDLQAIIIAFEELKNGINPKTDMDSFSLETLTTTGLINKGRSASLSTTDTRSLLAVPPDKIKHTRSVSLAPTTSNSVRPNPRSLYKSEEEEQYYVDLAKSVISLQSDADSPLNKSIALKIIESQSPLSDETPTTSLNDLEVQSNGFERTYNL